MMPNMMPRVGRGKSPGIFYNTGHGHLGVTYAATNARLMGDLITAVTYDLPVKLVVFDNGRLGMVKLDIHKLEEAAQ